MHCIRRAMDVKWRVTSRSESRIRQVGVAVFDGKCFVLCMSHRAVDDRHISGAVPAVTIPCRLRLHRAEVSTTPCRGLLTIGQLPN